MMNNKKNILAEEADVMPEETPEKEAAIVLSEAEDPNVMLEILEKKAKLAPRMKELRDTILASQTYPDDWQEFNSMVCLSSAGAERVGMLFSIKFFEVSYKKETFRDGLGSGYRYIYTGKATMGDRVMFATGIYSTRDKLLGKVGEEYKSIEDINENFIQMAADHIFKGNAIKALLGLRGIPRAEWEKIMQLAKKDTSKTKKVEFGLGTKGGTFADDLAKQKELAELLLELGNEARVVEIDEEGKYHINIAKDDIKGPLMAAQTSCKNLSSFWSEKDKKMVIGPSSVKTLKGQWLARTLDKAKVLIKEYREDRGDGN